MKTARIVRLVLVVLVLAMSVSNIVMAAPVTLTHYGYPGHGQGVRSWVTWAAQKFMEENPDIKIEISVAASGSEYKSKFPVMYAGNVAPDILEMPSSSVNLALNGYYLNLKPFMDSDPSVKRDLWPATVIDTYYTQGKQWALPFFIYPYLYWYNADLFDQNGLVNPNQLGENWTWDTLRSAAKKITKDENGDGIMDYYGIDTLWATWSTGTAVLQAGGKLYNTYDLPTESRINTPEVLKALEWVTDLYVKDRVTPPYDASSADIDKFYLWNGRTGMAVHWGPTIIGTYLSKAKCNWDVTMPVKGPALRGTHFTGGGFQISSQTAHPEEAWRWIKFLTTNREVVERSVQMSGIMPALRSVYPSYKKLITPAPKSADIIFETLMSANTVHSYRTQISGVDTYSALMKTVFTGQKSPAVALAEADELSRKAFTEYYAKETSGK